MKKVLNTLLGKNILKKLCRPLCIMLPNMSSYRSDFDETKYVFFNKEWWIARQI